MKLSARQHGSLVPKPAKEISGAMIVQFVVHHCLPARIEDDWLGNVYIISGPDDNRPLPPSLAARHRPYVSRTTASSGETPRGVPRSHLVATSARASSNFTPNITSKEDSPRLFEAQNSLAKREYQEV